MRYLFYLAHPAHFHLFKNTIKKLELNGHDVRITIKSKDVLQQLLDENGFNYLNISPTGRKPGKMGVLTGMLQRNIAHFNLVRKWRPDHFVSTSAEFAPIARLMGIRTVSFFEDDLELFPWYSRLLVPFLDLQVCPESCSAARWDNHPKTIKYRGNHELAYLRPEYFQPDYESISHIFKPDARNFLLRLSGLKAWHDEGIHGLNDDLAEQIVRLLSPYGTVFISSERPLHSTLEKHRLKCPASLMPHLLASADLVVSDSQTMTAEAAVLGTPAVRYTDFAGKIGYLNELEKTYGLCFAYKPGESEECLNKIIELVSTQKLKTIWYEKRQLLLDNSIDPTELFTTILEQANKLILHKSGTRKNQKPIVHA